jgi:Rrf2 family transcriptional regulator, cysteine metabolism repressor
MMKLSTKARYGLRSALEIAKMYDSDTPAKRKDIAAKQNISDSYLENILIILKNSRIIETTRGINGGYILSRPPKDISVLEIINALEGPLDLVECVSSAAACEKSDTCTTRSIWKELADAWKAILEKKTLQDLLDHETASMQPNYII